MSRLVEKLKSVSGASAPSLGFRAAAATRGPHLLLLARLGASDGKLAADLAEAGADALLMQGSSVASLQGSSGRARNVPCGVLMHQAGEDQLPALRKAGCDFMVMSAAAAPVSWLREEGMGRVLRVLATADMGQLRGVDHIGVDAILLEPEEESGFVTVQFLMASHFLSEALRQPVLASAPASASVDDVRALWEAGVSGVVMEIDVDKVKELRRFIDSLPARPRRRGHREDALLPRLSRALAPQEEEEEEE